MNEAIAEPPSLVGEASGSSVRSRPSRSSLVRLASLLALAVALLAAPGRVAAQDGGVADAGAAAVDEPVNEEPENEEPESEESVSEEPQAPQAGDEPGEAASDEPVEAAGQAAEPEASQDEQAAGEGEEAQPEAVDGDEDEGEGGDDDEADEDASAPLTDDGLDARPGPLGVYPTESRRLHPEGLDPCQQDLRPRPVGPLQVGDLDGMLGVAHRACPRYEVALGGDLLLVADTSNFYGNVRVNGRARISAPLYDPRVEAFLSWEAFRYQTVISSVSAAYTGLGYLSWGASGQVLVEDGRVLAVTGRMVLPTTTGLDQNSQPLALDVGLTGAWQADPHLRLHMWVTLLGSVGVGGPAEPRGGVRVGGGFDWRPAEWISFVIELQSGFGYRDALDLIAAQAGVRLALGTEVGLELAASLPLVGERALDDGALPLAASLMLNWYVR